MKAMIASAPDADLLNISDLNTTVNHEPRISHIRLARALGVAEHRAILRLIGRNREELERYGAISVTVTENTDVIGRGRPGKTLWLNEPQALLICIRSDAARAPAVRQAVISIFMDWRRGRDGVVLSEPEMMLLAAYRHAVARGVQDALAGAMRAEIDRQVTARINRAGLVAGMALADIALGRLAHAPQGWTSTMEDSHAAAR